MNYYLVDFENVGDSGLKKLLDTKKEGKVLIFYSKQVKKIVLDVVERMNDCKLQVRAYKVKSGTKNALDFQLASHIGYLIGKKNKNEKYYIVSKDKGYDCLCDYWKKFGASVQRIAPEEAAASDKKKKLTKRLEEVEPEIEVLVAKVFAFLIVLLCSMMYLMYLRIFVLKL